MKKLKPNLFDLTPAEIETSIAMYGKVIKCLIAPYHNITNIPLESNDVVYVYPERDLTIQQRKEIVSVMANSDKTEICFVTSDVFIIRDMVDSCTRILTPDGELAETPEKTFAANHHTVLHSVLSDKHYVKRANDEKEKSMKIINKVITDINKGSMTRAEYAKTNTIIDNIGEQIISGKLKEMLRDVNIIQDDFKKDSSGAVEFNKEELKYLKDRSWFKENLSVKECLKQLRDTTQQEEKKLSLLDELIGLLLKTPEDKEGLKKHKEDKETLEAQLKLRHKIEYWLTEQKDNAKIQNVLK